MQTKKVLIVDDEVELCELLRTFLVKRHYDVTISHTLSDCQSKTTTDSFDLVFLDNNLPDGIGWEYAPEIVEKNPDTFIALISAYNPSQMHMPENARYKVIEKPLKFSQIEADLQHIFATAV